MKAENLHMLTEDDLVRGGVVVSEDMTLREAAGLMAERRADAAAVNNARGRCAGLLLATALVRGLADGSRRPEPTSVWSEWQMSVPGEKNEAFCHKSPEHVAVSPDTPLVEAARQAFGAHSRRSRR
jgi:CBS domain-containing protein